MPIPPAWRQRIPKNRRRRPSVPEAAKRPPAARPLQAPRRLAIMAVLLITPARSRGITPVASEPSFADLMARLRAGDDAAAAALFQRFATRLIALARGRLDGLVRRKVDPEDVVQSVFRS